MGEISKPSYIKVKKIYFLNFGTIFLLGVLKCCWGSLDFWRQDLLPNEVVLCDRPLQVVISFVVGATKKLRK